MTSTDRRQAHAAPHPKPCTLCAGANLRVASGPVKPCGSRDVATLYADSPALPCGAAIAKASA